MWLRSRGGQGGCGLGLWFDLAVWGSIAAIIFLRRNDVNHTHGSARFLPIKDARRAGLFSRRGFLFGQTLRGLSLPYRFNGSGHILLVCPTGGGKGTSFIIPNLVRLPFVLLVDPGGENTAISIKAWRDKGYRIACLNPHGMHTSEPWALPQHGFNPLDILDPGADRFGSDADLLASMIVGRHSGREDGSAAFFKAEARDTIKAMLMHIALHEPPDRRTLLTLREYILADPDAWESLLSDMRDSSSDTVQRAAIELERTEANAGAQFQAVMSTMKSDTNFIEDPLMRAALARTDTNFEILKGRDGNGAPLPGAAVSIILPLEYVETHAAFTRLMIGCAIWTMQRGEPAREKVLFMLDEFAALGRVDLIISGMATLRKYRVWLMPVFQSLGQIKEIYGQGWSSIVGNAELRLFVGAWDTVTADEVSKMCGTATVDVFTRSPGGKEQHGLSPRPLLTPEEILHMPAGRVLAFIGSLHAVLARTMPYWERARLRRLVNPNPFYQGVPRRAHGAWLRDGWQRISRGALATLYPGRIAMIALLLLSLWRLDPVINIGQGATWGSCRFLSWRGIEETHPLYSGNCFVIHTRYGGF